MIALQISFTRIVRTSGTEKNFFAFSKVNPVSAGRTLFQFEWTSACGLDFTFDIGKHLAGLPG